MEPPADPSRVIKWTRPATFATPPPARGGHTASIVGNLLVVFGGTRYSGSGKFEYFNDLWALDLDNMTWHKPKLANKGPSGRYGHSACVVDFKLYVFGGKDETGVRNDLWELDVESWTWSLLPSAATMPPSSRMCATMTAVADKLSIFGGWDSKQGTYQDFWLYDLSTKVYLKPPTTGVSPPSRYGHSCIYDENSASLIVFGGCGFDAEGIPIFMSDLRVLDLRRLAWSRPRVGGDDTPGARYWHCAAQVGNVMVVSNGWCGPKTSTTAPKGAAGAAGSTTGGGSTQAAPEYPSIEIDIPYTPGMGGDALAGGNITVPYGPADAYLFDCESSEFVQPSIAGKPPGYRYGAAAAVSGANYILVGGWEGGRALSDIVVLDLSGLISGGGDGGAGGADGGVVDDGGAGGMMAGGQ